MSCLLVINWHKFLYVSLSVVWEPGLAKVQCEPPVVNTGKRSHVLISRTNCRQIEGLIRLLYD